MGGVIICESELERGPLWCLIRWFNVTACLQGATTRVQRGSNLPSVQSGEKRKRQQKKTKQETRQTRKMSKRANDCQDARAGTAILVQFTALALPDFPSRLENDPKLQRADQQAVE